MATRLPDVRTSEGYKTINDDYGVMEMAKYICSRDGMMNVLIKGGRAVEKTTVRNDKSGEGNMKELTLR
ncbi:conserved hypothetical protein [Ricinus communis]|uniref:Uncharacterized protein n=1 Tax=Ricinus communis TaxID=3988 RepID=B9SJF5_RICCO|nr:conserved hypothetical protein [Ricinus communis]